ncbi:MAG TPA: formylglycine-generating enzyme family protein, partial [Kofleriaceae bacterium]|nr:formylglycine-generating enzyme family protein [Kofleriaceae bacterium]
RGWRDDAAGQRGLRTRLGAAADEWRRLGRRAEALWNAPQLAEAAGLDDLADSDRTFLDASRRAARRRRVARTAIAISLPAVVVATWFAIRHQNHGARDRAVAGHADRAADHLRVAQAARDQADRDRTDAFRAFDSDHGDGAEVLWHRARTEVTSAHAAYAAAASELEAAVLLDGDRDDIRAQLAHVIFDHALVAEADRDPTAANEIATRLVAFDSEGSLVASWRKPAELTVTAPAAVAIELRRYDDHDGRLELGEPITSTTGHQLVRDVEAGSYLVELRGRDGMVVRCPVLLARAETVTLEVKIPNAASVPAGMIYIPPGRFLYGGVGDEIYRRHFLSTVPLHTVATRGYSIAKHEVTFAEWIAYLRALPPAERELRRPRMSSNAAAAVILAGGTRADEPFALDLRELIELPVVREGQPLVFADRATRHEVRWENTPVTGISFNDARAYADWLDHTGRLPGARLCTDLEWERAARGADGRVWTTGDRLDDDDANIDVTYARKPHGMGPDEVGMHPRSTSPFGVDDMVGNAYELVVDSRGRPVQRSGSWWHTSATAQSANRDLAEPTLRVAWLGIRLCTGAP